MPNYTNLPGSSFAVLDGGLRSAVTYKNKATLVIATCAQGPAGSAVQITDSSVAANLFGLSGTAMKAVSEVMSISDNVLLWRLGTTAATLLSIGQDPLNSGYSLTLGQRQVTASSIYSIWYSKGALYLYLNGNLVYANDVASGVFVDANDSLVDGVAVGGLNICAEKGVAFQPTHTYALGDQVKPAVYSGFNYVCTIPGVSGAAEPVWGTVLGALTVSATATFKVAVPSTPSFANSRTLLQAAVTVSAGTFVAPTLTAAVDGTAMTGRQTYVALAQALDLLSTQRVAQVYCPNVKFDNSNVAFYVSTDATTLKHNPVTNLNALDWLNTLVDPYGNAIYTWASDVNAVFVSPTDRLNQGYHEVNFGYLLARFCAAQQEQLGGCVAFIGTYGPSYYNNTVSNRFDLLSTRQWVGSIPKYDINGHPVSFGVGLCGIPYMSGTTASKMNSLTSDFTQGFRLPGFFENLANEYDGGASTDKNGNSIDIGQYLHVVYDYQLLSNSYASSYIGNIAGVVAGKAATLDQKQSLLSKTVLGVSPIWAPNFAQMNALSFSNLNGLRGDEPVATLIHDNTAAVDTSDWITLYNVNLRFMISTIGYKRGKTFLGTNALNGLQATALLTGLDADSAAVQTRGYISSCKWTLTTTASSARIGALAIDVSFSAPGQLRKLNFSIGIAQSVATN